MIARIVEYFKSLFFPAPVVEQEKPKSGFSLDNPWLFTGDKPTGEDIQNLMDHLVLEEGHAFYVRYGDKKRVVRYGVIPLYARRIVWWLEGRGVPESASGTHPVGIRSNCGETECIKLSHLILDQPKKILGPENNPNKPLPAVKEVKKSSQPPVYKPKKKWERKAPPNAERSKCVSAKAWFASEAEAREVAKELNKVEVRRTNRKGMHRVHPYKCDMACLGWHLTSKNPSKRKSQKTKGSWS